VIGLEGSYLFGVGDNSLTESIKSNCAIRRSYKHLPLWLLRV
jgi:hypothetical protein